MSFYLTLPSTVTLKGLEDHNTNAHYFTRLDRPLDLHAAEWEVGLSEIILPSSTLNVPTGSIKIKDGDEGVKEIPFQHGNYASLEDMTIRINSSIREEGFSNEDVEIFYFQQSNKFEVHIHQEKLEISIDGALAKAMGFGEQVSVGNGKHSNTHPPHLMGKNEILYVYSSLAAPRLVGDSMVSLLRVFTAGEGGRYGMDHIEFKHVHYVPIQNLSTELVEIDIRRDNGMPVSFFTGKVVVTVHFRKKI